MKNSAIQWTDHTFNPWEGCAKVAPECKNCYAETLVDHRFGRVKWGKGQPRRRTSKNLWKQPIRWNAEAEHQFRCQACGELIEITQPGLWNCGACGGKLVKIRPRVFCLSLGDWLDEEVPIEWLADLLELIVSTQNLDWQLLTKRPQNWQSRIDAALDILSARQSDAFVEIDCWLSKIDSPGNIWIGVSAGADQKAALEIPAKIHFLSCEPMLHPLDTLHAAGFDWIIFGGESGKNARPCDIRWIRDGLQFCRRNDIAPFVKQLGAKPYWEDPAARSEFDVGGGMLELRDSHGGEMSEWPEDLQVREFPK